MQDMLDILVMNNMKANSPTLLQVKSISILIYLVSLVIEKRIKKRSMSIHGHGNIIASY